MTDRRTRPGDPSREPATILDTVFLAQLAGEIGEDGVVEILRIFHEDAPPHMTAIHRAMDAGAVQTVRREAHALAGAARTVGLTLLARHAAALQRASEGSGPALIMVEALESALRQSLPVAAAWADAHDEALAAPHR
jgi:HPt (histidine-containing phosphotransfer) domain-containing protein